MIADWDDTHDYWILREPSMDLTYYFELPHDILLDWVKSSRSRQAAINIKEQYFKTILVYSKTQSSYPELKTMRISEAFLQHALNNLDG